MYVLADFGVRDTEDWIMFQTAMPILDKLDPYQFFITYKLFRDATRSVNGTPVKVRNMSSCILLTQFLNVGLDLLES